jgi:prephenate dehydrogenase
VIADESADHVALNKVSEVISRIEATPIALTAEEHDRIAARVSHVPQMLSIALALAVARKGEAPTIALAGSGFAEMTRLARSPWRVWEDICRTNADEIASALDETIAEVEAVRAAISGGDFSSLGEMFGKAGELTSNVHDEKRQKLD